MKRKLWILLMAILIISGGKIFVDEKGVEVWLNLSKFLVRDSSEVGFSYSGIDSLFSIKSYKYLMFVDDSFEGGIPLFGLEDSVLVLTSERSILKDKKTEVFFLPKSSLEFWVNVDVPFRMYRIKEVLEREKGNMYRLHKIE